MLKVHQKLLKASRSKRWYVGKYRKKPVVIDAIQYTGIYNETVKHFLGEQSHEFDDLFGVKINTREGIMLAEPGDWIIRGIKGELYPCKPDIFDATYEPVA
jgi:hypothetical protein